MALEDGISLDEIGSFNQFFEDDTNSCYSEAESSPRTGSNLCKRNKKDTFVYREGPAPLEDVKLKGEFKESFYPGALSNASVGNNDADRKASSSGLLNYFQKLSHSNGNELIDVEFIDSLLKVGADINISDAYGQTIMHEVARQWNVAVAEVCIDRFADIDKPDHFGRSPLHLACAVNYPEMIEWLVKNGANINRRTKGETQTPIHYAAKNNAIEAINTLIEHGASILDRDYKSQMPLFVAADAGRVEACRLLLEKGAPAGIFNDCGVSCLSIMIEKMPDVAKLALEQFQLFDNALRRKYYYLNYLEVETWRVFESKKGKPLRQSFARSPLQMIVQYQELSLVVHPVILNLIQMKWHLFGKRNAILVLVINIIYTLIWTAIGVTMPKDHTSSFYSPLKDKWWRFVLETIGSLMTLTFIVIQVVDYRKEKDRLQTYKAWKIREIERDLQFCHPQWPEEKRFLESEISRVNYTIKSALLDWWVVFEWVTFAAILCIVITRGVAILYEDESADKLHHRLVSVALILVWLRLMKFCRSFQALGPFITMLGHVIDSTVKFGFLFFELFIPYCCAFWILFGGKKGTEFNDFGDLMYQVFMMTLVADYEFSQLKSQDKIMAQLLVGTYLAVASVVCLNLYIALMSETFARVWSDATANAYMSQATQLLITELNLGDKEIERINRHLLENCSPQIVQESSQAAAAFNEKELILSLSTRLEELFSLSLRTAEESIKMRKEIDKLRIEVSELREVEEACFKEVLDVTKETSMTKLKSMITNMQEGIGDKFRRVLAKDKAPSEIYDSDDDDKTEEKTGSIVSFFSRKKKD